ncbi:MAG TPA: hypothetical protein VF669_04820 [Tepidisphaeraceae bacterium]|jgi:hypothetical protein
MSKDWIMKKESEFIVQAADFTAKIAAAPTSYGLSSSDATALSTDNTAAQAAYELAADPATRTKPIVEDKDTKLAVLEARMRSYGKRINANSSVTNAQKASLGLTIKSAPAPIPAPSTMPSISVVSSFQRSVRVKMTDSATGKKAKPAGVSEAEVFTHIGATAPANMDDWKYQGQATRSLFDITFPATVQSGAKVWIVARWCNERGQAGPFGSPVGTIIVGSIADAA